MEGSYLPSGRTAGLPGRPTESTNLADILERVLDKGIVIAGDIQINLLDIELLTIKLRLLIASVDRAREMGIDWWEGDPSLRMAARKDGVNGGGGPPRLEGGDRAVARRAGGGVRARRGGSGGPGRARPTGAGSRRRRPVGLLRPPCGGTGAGG